MAADPAMTSTAPPSADVPAPPAGRGGDGSMRRDLATAYVAAAAKVGSWAAVSAIVYRSDRAAFALLALVRATLGLLTYTSLGLAPAMIRMLAAARRQRAVAPPPTTPAHRPATDDPPADAAVLSYARRPVP